MKKSTLMAIGAFAVLLVVVLLTREEHVNVGVPKLTLPTIDPGAVTALDISGASQAKLTFDSGVWSVAASEKRFVADENQVKSALTQLAELKASDFVTENVAKHAELEVDDAKGLRVKVTTSAGPALEIIIGKAAKTGGTYLRQPTSNSVFTTKSNVGYALKKPLNGWRKKNITTAALADVAKISFAGAFTVTQGENNTWSLEGTPPVGFRFDTAAAGRLAQTLTSLSAQDFAEDDAAAAFAAEHPIATLTRKDGQAVVIHFGAKRPDGNVPVRVEADPQVYVVSGYLVEQLPKQLEQLRDTTLFALTPDKVTRVTITAAGKKTVLIKDGPSWKFVEPKTAPPEFDSAQVTAWLTRLQTQRATRAAPEMTLAQAGLSTAAPVVELAIEGAKPQALRFGRDVATGAVGQQVYVRGGADDLVYVVGAHEKTKFDAGPLLFNRPPPPPQNMGQMQGLDSLPPDVRAKLEAQLRQRQMQ